MKNSTSHDWMKFVPASSQKMRDGMPPSRTLVPGGFSLLTGTLPNPKEELNGIILRRRVCGGGGGPEHTTKWQLINWSSTMRRNICRHSIDIKVFRLKGISFINVVKWVVLWFAIWPWFLFAVDWSSTLMSHWMALPLVFGGCKFYF